MDETIFRILEVLTSNPGRVTTIMDLTKRFKERKYPPHYANIYGKVQELRSQGVIKLEKRGNASLITLNFANPHLLRLLSDMERKKKDALERAPELPMLMHEMTTYFRQGLAYLNSISLIAPERTRPQNRAEFLFILSEPHEQYVGIFLEQKQDTEQFLRGEMNNIHRIMKSLQTIHTLKLDYLILREKELLALLRERDKNPVRNMLGNQIAFFQPEDYWITVGQALASGGSLEGEDVNPSKLSEKDIVYNLYRFGYGEIGTTILEGRAICLETLIVSLLLSHEARRVHAIPLLLAKAEEAARMGKGKRPPQYGLLRFLAMKYQVAGRLMGLLRVFVRVRGGKEAEQTLKVLEMLKVAEEPANEKAIREAMRRYHVLG